VVAVDDFFGVLIFRLVEVLALPPPLLAAAAVGVELVIGVAALEEGPASSRAEPAGLPGVFLMDEAADVETGAGVGLGASIGLLNGAAAVADVDPATLVVPLGDGDSAVALDELVVNDLADGVWSLPAMPVGGFDGVLDESVLVDGALNGLF
jgi:hypothetical protein